MLNVGGSSRKKMEKEMGILDGEMQSRWDRLHSEGGVVDVLVDSFNAMAELRMKAQYGDYLGYACEALKTEDMATMRWKVDRLNWQATAERILEEEDKREEEEGRRTKPLSPTPFVENVIKAAEKLGCDPRMIRYQILQYAARNNNLSHSGIGEMIEEARFRELADAIIEDKRALGVIFRGRPGEEIQMRNLIVKIEKEWFVELFVHETSHGKVNQYIPTAKHIARLERIADHRFRDP